MHLSQKAQVLRFQVITVSMATKMSETKGNGNVTGAGHGGQVF